jgi:hypothetical protein
MQVIFKSDSLLQIGTSDRIYPCNEVLEISEPQLTKLRQDLKDVPRLEILERKSPFSDDEIARIDAVISSMVGKMPEAQEHLLRQGFEEFSPVLRQELKQRVLIAFNLPDSLKRECDRILESVAIWDRTP